MAPSFEHLPDPEEDYDEDEELDFSDLRERFEVQLESGLDSFVVVDQVLEEEVRLCGQGQGGVDIHAAG
jgi:translation initiation factor 3 subunit B